MIKKLITILTIIFCFSIASSSVFAEYFNVEYESSSSNDTKETAQPISSEVLKKGTFPAGDSNDYYKFTASSGSEIYIQLSYIPTGCDYDLWLLNSSGTSLADSRNGSDLGEFINYTANYTGTYYIRVYKYSGTPPSNNQYNLYAQTSGVIFNKSFYVEKPHNLEYMRYLGRDHTNNISKKVILSFGQPDKSGSTYGVYGYNENFVSYSQITAAVNAFIAGYNENYKHNKSIEVIVGVTNQKGSLPQNTTEWYNNGVALKNCILNINTSGDVTYVGGGYDAEMAWNHPSYTKALASGFNSQGASRQLVNYGSHNGADNYDWSSEDDPEWEVKHDTSNEKFYWKASDVHYLSWGLSCAYAMPQIYNTAHARRWTYQKKWQYISYSGFLSTNKWSEYNSALLSNQQSYSEFNTFLYNNSVGQPLTHSSWIARKSQ